MTNPPACSSVVRGSSAKGPGGSTPTTVAESVLICACPPRPSEELLQRMRVLASTTKLHGGNSGRGFSGLC